MRVPGIVCDSYARLSLPGRRAEPTGHWMVRRAARPPRAVRAWPEHPAGPDRRRRVWFEAVAFLAADGFAALTHRQVTWPAVSGSRRVTLLVAEIDGEGGGHRVVDRDAAGEQHRCRGGDGAAHAARHRLTAHRRRRPAAVAPEVTATPAVGHALAAASTPPWPLGLSPRSDARRHRAGLNHPLVEPCRRTIGFGFSLALSSWWFPPGCSRWFSVCLR